MNSDGDGAYEWTATVLNVNTGHNKELLDACRILREYSLFVECSRKYLQNEAKDNLSRFEAMRAAVDECIEREILTEFLLKNKAGVINMYLTEWDEEAYRTVLKEESREEGKIEERNEINKLIKCLLEDNRIDDLRRSTTDLDFQNRLLVEYGIIS